jgi:hypothetical protein
MQYLLLIFDDQDELAKLDAATRARVMADYLAFTDDIRRTGHFRGGNALEPVTTATTIRVRGGRRVMVDGACAETREQLAGYYVVEAADLDEAIALAERLPSTQFGAVEVRPVMRLQS